MPCGFRASSGCDLIRMSMKLIRLKRCADSLVPVDKFTLDRKDALMILPRIALAVLSAVLLFSFASAQTRRPGSRPTTAKPAATPTPVATPQPTPAPSINPASPPIAIVNGVPISATDIEDDVRESVMRDPDQYLRDYYLDPAKAIREARQRAVEARLSSMLIDAEAKKRGKTSSELVEAEVNSKIA